MALKLAESLIPNDSQNDRLYGSKFHLLPFLFLFVSLPRLESRPPAILLNFLAEFKRENSFASSRY